jgi:hypothetical protein
MADVVAATNFDQKLIRDPDLPIGTHGHVSVSRRGGNACGRSRATRHWANRHESRRPRRRLPAVRPTSADQRSSSSRDGHIITSGWYGLSYSGARSPRCAIHVPHFPRAREFHGLCTEDATLSFATDLTPYRICANRSFDHLVGAPGITAATPSGLMLKAKNVKGVSLGFPH